MLAFFRISVFSALLLLLSLVDAQAFAQLTKVSLTADRSRLSIDVPDAPESGFTAGNSAAATSSSTQVQAGPQLPEPGQAGSPFSVDHFWRHFSLDISGGYSPVLNRGVGYYGPGYTVSAGAFYRFNSRWGLLGEGQILGQHGNFSAPTCDTPGQCDNGSVASYIVAFHVDPVYYLRSGAATSPFVVGGGGYYHLGTHGACGPSAASGCLTTTNDPFVTDVLSVNAAGFNVGAGVRHRLFDVRQTELYADVRYHYIASGSSSVGQVSFLPISAGIRW